MLACRGSCRHALQNRTAGTPYREPAKPAGRHAPRSTAGIS